VKAWGSVPGMKRYGFILNLTYEQLWSQTRLVHTWWPANTEFVLCWAQRSCCCCCCFIIIIIIIIIIQSFLKYNQNKANAQWDTRMQ
jgi:hypothetical protein